MCAREMFSGFFHSVPKPLTMECGGKTVTTYAFVSKVGSCAFVKLSLTSGPIVDIAVSRGWTSDHSTWTIEVKEANLIDTNYPYRMQI